MFSKTEPILAFLQPAFKEKVDPKPLFVYYRLGLHFGLVDGEWHSISNKDIQAVVEGFDKTAASRAVRRLKEAGLIEIQYKRIQSGCIRGIRFTEKGLGRGE